MNTTNTINTNIENFINSIMVLDTETTGVDAESEIIEFSASFPEGANDDYSTLVNYTQRFKPEHGVPAEASAIHYITEDDLNECELFRDASTEFMGLFKTRKYFIGHNVLFDRNMLINNLYNTDQEIPEYLLDDSRWICTYKLAKKVLQENTDYTNLTLSFLWFKLEVYKDCTHKIIPHSAEDDVYMCYKVLLSLVNKAIEQGLINPSAEDIGKEIIDLCNIPNILKTMTIGQHKGKLMEEVPTSYLNWLITQSDKLNPEHVNYDIDLAYTVEAEYNRRLEEHEKDSLKD